jgi:hypothetical protein
MKKILNIILMIILFSSTTFASLRGDVTVLGASEHIRLVGQKIAKNYLYYYQNPKKTELKTKIYKDIEALEESLIEIATTTKSRDSKNILDFLAYNKDEIKLLLEQKVNRERSILMLDYSESFLEGASSIANEHKYVFSLEEKMLVAFKDLEYFLERISKYYIASTLDLDRKNNFANMKESIVYMEHTLEEINNYSYPPEVASDVKEMNTIWIKHKTFLSKSDKVLIPNLLMASESILKDFIHKIALYHKQNQ